MRQPAELIVYLFDLNIGIRQEIACTRLGLAFASLAQIVVRSVALTRQKDEEEL